MPRLKFMLKTIWGTNVDRWILPLQIQFAKPDLALPNGLCAKIDWQMAFLRVHNLLFIFSCWLENEIKILNGKWEKWKGELTFNDTGTHTDEVHQQCITEAAICEELEIADPTKKLSLETYEGNF